MRQRQLLASLLRRHRRPGAWLGALFFGLLWFGQRLVMPPQGPGLHLTDALVPILIAAAILALAPLPWQWTGDERPMAPVPRGLLQSLPFNALWLAALLVLLRATGLQPAPAHPLPPPPGAGPLPPAPITVTPGREPQERLAPGAAPSPVPGPEAPSTEPPPPATGPSEEGDARPTHPEARPPHRPGPGPRGGPPFPPPPGRRPPGSPTKHVLIAREDAPGAPSSPAMRPEGQALPFRHAHPDLFFLLLNLPISVLLGWFVADRERAETEAAALQARSRRAHNLSLQAQMAPHALFNALSGLTELVHEDPDAAEAALVALADLLHQLMDQTGRVLAPLREERALIKAYLLVEEIRLGPRLTVHWSWPAWADGLELPPLLLQPLVENAVEHGIAAAPEGGEVTIEVARDGVDLLLRVTNTSRPFDPKAKARGGLGLGNLRRRLKLLPELRGRLLVRTHPDQRTVAEIRFPQSGRLQLALEAMADPGTGG